MRWDAAIAALCVGLGLQIAANFANDAFDFEKGADGADRLGPTRTAQAGLLTPRQLRVGLAVVLAASFLAGSYLAVIASPLFWVVGILGMVSAVAYTAGPYPLGYNGLGDIFVIVFFGFVAVCGTTFSQVGRIPLLAWLAAIPAGSLATAILAVNNIRDRHTDARAGKRTLAVRFGRRFVMLEFLALVAIAYAIPVLLLALGELGPAALIPWATLPLAIQVARRVARDEGRPLNDSLANTAKLLAIYGTLFATGIVWG